MNDIAYYFLFGAMTMLSLTGLWLTFVTPGLDRWNRRFFRILFSCLVLCMLSYLVDLILYRYPNETLLIKLSWSFETLLMSLTVPMLTVYLLHCCGEGISKSPLIGAVSGLWLVYSGLALIAPFTSFLYDVGPNELFIPGAWYPLSIAPLILIMILNLQALLVRRRKLSRRTFYALLIGLIPLMTAMIIHIFVLTFMLLYIGVSISSFAMFAIILFGQFDQYMRQQQEIARQRASILMLEMRPHFIYNTMTSIYYLCDLDPQKAKQVTMDFTTYLRKNLTAIASENTIPFADELEHTRAYLSVERAQFEDKLFVDYDTPHTNFRLPPLTLQPIVENSVKHGLDPDSEPLHILIRTRKTAAGSLILVSDNGPGFEPAEDDEPHIALRNIRQRLEMMCGGKLEILACEGGGTMVRVTIPG